MYLINDMIDMGLGKDKKWKSSAHRLVAIGACVANDAITTMEVLSHNCEKINSISNKKIKNVTVQDLIDEGCVIT